MPCKWPLRAVQRVCRQPITYSNYASSATLHSVPVDKEQVAKKTRRPRAKKPSLDVGSALFQTHGGVEASLASTTSLGTPKLTQSNPEPATPARKRRTTKPFSDLPSSYIPNGALAVALPSRWTEDPRIKTTTAPILIPDIPVASAAPATRSFPKTQLANDIVENLVKFPHCILLTRVGNFYESYFDQAADVARLLTIKLTTRSWGGARVPMCGFPLGHLDRHLKRLVQGHKRFAAICEEFKKRDGTFERRVVRVVTPGTLIDESFVDPFENNYLMSISFSGPQVAGLAWMDVATGEFFTQQATHDNLGDDIARISPREVILPEELRHQPDHPLRKLLLEENITVSYVALGAATVLPPVDVTFGTPADVDVLSKALESASSSVQSPNTSPKFSSAEVGAIALLTAFLRGSLLDHMPGAGVLAPTHEDNESRMLIDSHTIKALEIKEEIREGGVTGSLMSVIRRTVTSSGARLLERRLCSPSTSISLINARQSIVSLFYSFPHLRQDLIRLLKETEDASRIVQKFLLGKGDTDDLIALKNTIGVWERMRLCVGQARRSMRPDIQSDDSWKTLEALMGKMAGLKDLSDKIESAVDDRDHGKGTSPAMVEDGFMVDDLSEHDEFSEQTPSSGVNAKPWTIRPQFSRQLTSLHRKFKKLQSAKDQMELMLREQTGAQSLMLNSTSFQGWHVKIPKVKDARNLINAETFGFIDVSKSLSSRNYFYAPWTTLGSSIMETQAAIFNAERDAFLELRSEVNSYGGSLRRNAHVGDELDVALAFANLAEEMKLCRPTVDDSTSYHVTNGRHPTVELGLLRGGKQFVPNTVEMEPTSRIHIITGPNMAGKSTLLRQTAIIAILAQAGSFVPADYAKIGIVDKVFSRIGAKDDLYRGRSTFMVEMLETADILKKATGRSLVIMDEVGRGTTVTDGVAIAFAAAKHLHDINRCRTLFATHFHDVADMLGYDEEANRGSPRLYDAVGFFCTDVDETEDGYFSYSHRMRPGVNRDSHGLKVARMAGMPEVVIEVASKVVDQIERQRAAAGYHVATKM